MRMLSRSARSCRDHGTRTEELKGVNNKCSLQLRPSAVSRSQNAMHQIRKRMLPEQALWVARMPP